MVETAEVAIDEASAEAAQTFAAKKQVFEWLAQNGYTRKKSAFYDHCRQGLLRARNGVYHLRDVQRYLKQHSDVDTLLLTEREKQARIRYTEARTREVQFALEVKQGKYVLRTDVTRMIIASWLALDRMLRQAWKRQAQQICSALGVQPVMASQLLNMLISTQESVFAEVASRPYSIEVSGDVDIATMEQDMEAADHDILDALGDGGDDAE